MRLVPAAIRCKLGGQRRLRDGPELQSLLRPIVSLYVRECSPVERRGRHAAGGYRCRDPDARSPGSACTRNWYFWSKAGLTASRSSPNRHLNPARVLGMANSFGPIEVGKLADLVLLDANPREASATPSGSAPSSPTAGSIRRADLDRLLAEVEALNSTARGSGVKGSGALPTNVRNGSKAAISANPISSRLRRHADPFAIPCRRHMVAPAWRPPAPPNEGNPMQALLALPLICSRPAITNLT